MATKSTLAFFLFFLVLCTSCNCQDQPANLADLGSCVSCDYHTASKLTEDQTRPTISSSSLFQNGSTDLTLQCNPAPGCDPFNSELIFSYDGTVLYNSTLKRENGVFRINATSIRFSSQNLHLSNLTCAYNNSLSSNSLDIPYLSIDEFQLGPTEFSYDKTSTISCKVSLNQKPDNYTVRFVFHRNSNFEFKHSNGEILWFNLANSAFRNQIELKQAGHMVVNEFLHYSAIFAINVKLIATKNNNGTDVDYLLFPIYCKLQYGDNELMSLESKQYFRFPH